ncbi:D123-domain-containing protein [Suillus subalutaceus]|uniref:D123-domain-containing protein n=1 Tax=Suillus subalutaceus TaxID=48586 RepID=UPI001B86860A|nr:D123-domain-containing protein [Suillus subalutaceus]KAG1851085.1 D123-domain-containing protein [Suillus subalutaceus]
MSTPIIFPFSSWYPLFSSISIQSTIIRLLNQTFKEYLDSDGIFAPEGSHAESSLSDEGDDNDEYGTVFPKLNFSLPKVSSMHHGNYILPPSSPLKFTSLLSDVHILLKSSDFISHDLSIDTVLGRCQSDLESTPYQLELFLRKWYPIDRSRELRCFVRKGRLIEALQHLWEESIKSKWHGQQNCTCFTSVAVPTLVSLLDFNSYAPRADPLLFTYEELSSVFMRGPSSSELRIVDSPLHPTAMRDVPAHQHNIEALALSCSWDIDKFSDLWQEEIQHSVEDNI